jgi:DNA polymerase elongation subunit (family B)
MDEEVKASQLAGVVVTEHQVSTTHSVLLATPHPDPGKPYFCTLLEKLLAERAAVRKLMKTETDPARLAILDARQKSKKICCNSAYGLLGAKTGYLPLSDLAAVTTFQGRQALQFSQKTAEEKYGACTIAGDTDSIMVILPPQPGVSTPINPDTEWKNARMKYVFEHGEEIGNYISSKLPPELVFELEVSLILLFLLNCRTKCFILIFFLITGSHVASLLL